MMGRNIWGIVGVLVFSYLPLMGVRGDQDADAEDLSNLNFLVILRGVVPDMTSTWDANRDSK